MSAKGQAFVEAHSPYSGNTYLIHLRFGMLENETYEHRLFMGDAKFAELCRCSTKTVQRAREQMIKDGFLRVVKAATKGHNAEYEFIFDEGLGGHSDPLGGHSVSVGWTSEESSPINRIKDKSKELSDRQKRSLEARAAVIYDTYPRKMDRAKAIAKIVALLRKGESDKDLLDAVAAYAATKIDSEPKYIKLAATFFNESWREWVPTTTARPLPQRPPDVDDNEIKRRSNESVAPPKDFAKSVRAQLTGAQ